ncbi:MAG: nitrogen regulation protein NR(II), partial [Gemmatimonadales bacterium]
MLSEQRFRLVVAGSLAGWLVVVAGFLLLPAGVPAALYLNSANAACGILGCSFFLRRAQVEPLAASGWRWLGTALLLQAIYQIHPVFTYIGTGALPSVPGPGDWLAVPILLSVGIGLLAWPAGPRLRAEQVRTALDGLLFAAATFSLIWIIALGKVVRSTPLSPVEEAAQIAVFGIAAADLGIVVYVGARTPRRYLGPLGWFTAALVGTTVTSMVVMVLELEGSYHLGHPIDLLLLLALVSAMVSAWSPVPVVGVETRDEAHDPSVVSVALPYLPALGVLVAGIWVLVRPGQDDPVLAWLGIGIAVVLLLRQFLLLSDLRQLSQTLEARVGERSRELEAAHAALAQTQRLEALGRIAGGIAHDFNNWLTVLQGSAHEALDAGLSDAERHAAIGEIQQVTGHAQRLTRQLLTFARQQAFEPKLVDLNKLLADAAPILRRLAGDGVTLEFRHGAGLPPLFADPSQLEQLVSNLLTNARNAMPDGGTVTIATAGVAEGGSSPSVRLTVSDTGEGIDESVVPHIFEPFFTTSADGTGLGLATC